MYSGSKVRIGTGVQTASQSDILQDFIAMEELSSLYIAGEICF